MCVEEIKRSIESLSEVELGEVVALLNDRWKRYERGEMPAWSWDKIRSEIRHS